MNEAIAKLQTTAADLYAGARTMRSDQPEASTLYAQRAAALSLAARVLAGVELAGDISAAGAAASHRPPHDALRFELDTARQALRVMSTNEGRLHLRIAQLETELAGLRRP